MLMSFWGDKSKILVLAQGAAALSSGTRLSYMEKSSSGAVVSVGTIRVSVWANNEVPKNMKVRKAIFRIKTANWGVSTNIQNGNG
jgi:hypothetical protein